MRPSWASDHPTYRDIAADGIEPNFAHSSWYNLAGGATNPLAKLGDPFFFPGLMSDDLLDNVPPMVVCSAEFCFFVEDAKHFIGRLRDKGKLLDSLVIPGGIHISWMFRLPGTDRWFRDRRVLSDRHLVATDVG